MAGPFAKAALVLRHVGRRCNFPAMSVQLRLFLVLQQARCQLTQQKLLLLLQCVEKADCP